MAIKSDRAYRQDDQPVVDPSRRARDVAYFAAFIALTSATNSFVTGDFASNSA